MKQNDFQDEIDVAKYQRDKICDLYDRTTSQGVALDEIEQMLKNANLYKNEMYPSVGKTVMLQADSEESKDFTSLLQAAHEEGYQGVSLFDVATLNEVAAANAELKRYYRGYAQQYELDAYDYAISGIVGTIAALLDALLVTETSESGISSGKLKSGVETLLSKALPSERIKHLEDKYKVSYDISKNTSDLSQEVLGLCPLYHRFMSLGHDPLLGFVFGVKDLMNGELTAIDGVGRLIVQNVTEVKVESLAEAIVKVFGHFLSDVVTQSKKGKILSVPAPFTPLLQLVDSGSIQYNGEQLTIAELSKKMFADGYNFNHCVGMSVPVFLIEILIRAAFFIKESVYYKKEMTALKKPKLNTMLFLANGILFSENMGKLAITQNPFSINYVSWVATANYGVVTLKWYTLDKALGEIDCAQNQIDHNWQSLLETKNGEQFLIG